MLTKIIIENYRCYDKHEIEFKDLSIIVGKNNAGKSTLVEALRYIALALSRFRYVGYCDPPNWTELPRIIKGIEIPLESFGFVTENMFYQYSEPPSKITASFSSKIEVTVFIGESPNIFCILKDSNGNNVHHKGIASRLNIEQINILPQLSGVQREEKVLSREYVRQSLNSSVASIHFRNQLLLLHNEYFNRFKSFAEESWSSLRIMPLERVQSNNGEKLSLMVQDSGFPSEIGWMGHGLQMWLQIIWFISRVNQNEVVILDEPDVYMHPDLQRKLIRLLKNKFKQTIVSTHSSEIISEVEVDNILIIDKTKGKSIYASNFPVAQQILNNIGSIHNLQLTRLWSAKKLLIVEGDDIAILKRLQNTLFPKSNEPFDTIPNFDIGGWGGWNYAIGSSMLIKETVDHSVKVYCLFDSDYHINEDKEERRKDAKRLSVNIHIWHRKEIENYLLVPSTILRIIKSESDKAESLSVKEINKAIIEESKKLIEDTIHSFADEITKKNRGLSVTTAIKQAKQLIDKIDHRVSGKKVISKLSKWAQENYNVSLSPIKLAQNLKKEEIDNEVIHIIESIEKSISF